MRLATDCTTKTDTFDVSPTILASAHGPESRPDGWKEARGLDARAAHELLASLAAAGCRRRQFAISGRDGSYVVRWV